MSTTNDSFPGLIHISYGGPIQKISVNKKIIDFEWHPYCGPIQLNKNGDPAARQENAFLEAASLWAQQGKRIEGDFCVWDHEPKPILQHMGGRHYKIIGMNEPVRGE